MSLIGEEASFQFLHGDVSTLTAAVSENVEFPIIDHRDFEPTDPTKVAFRMFDYFAVDISDFSVKVQFTTNPLTGSDGVWYRFALVWPDRSMPAVAEYVIDDTSIYPTEVGIKNNHGTLTFGWGANDLGSDESATIMLHTKFAPDEIELSNLAFAEHKKGAVIGDLSARDFDHQDGDTLEFKVSNENFEIVDGQLKLKAGVSFDHATTRSIDVTVTVTDKDNYSTDKTFKLEVEKSGITTIGDDGDNMIRGKSGNDRLFGKAGDDFISGAKGDDWLSGGKGDDRIHGGSGADSFAFYGHFGHDQILDFHADQGDRIVLHAVPGIANFEALLASHIEDTGKGALIATDDGSTILIRGVSVDELKAEQFEF